MFGSYYQVSEDFEPKIIKIMTDQCERTDCRVSARMDVTKCAATASHYNKDGIKVIDDRNSFTAYLCCSKCWNAMKVNSECEILEQERLRDG